MDVVKVTGYQNHHRLPSRSDDLQPTSDGFQPKSMKARVDHKPPHSANWDRKTNWHETTTGAWMNRKITVDHHIQRDRHQGSLHTMTDHTPADYQSTFLRLPNHGMKGEWQALVPPPLKRVLTFQKPCAKGRVWRQAVKP